MTPDEAGLLAAVREAPEDDLPRLVYADWCEDNGRPERAEFIRAQIVYAQMDADGHTPDLWVNHPRKDCPRQFDLEGCEDCSRMIVAWKRMTNLFGPRGDEWFAAESSKFDQPLLSCVGLDPRDQPNYSAMLSARRGFIDEVRCPLKSWWEHGPALVAAHPIQRVRLTDREPWVIAGERFYWTQTNDNAPWPDYFERFRYCLPHSIWVLTGQLSCDWWPTAGEAIDAVNAAALLWAKKSETASRSVAAGD